MVVTSRWAADPALDAEVERSVQFHGHMCPGLAIGVRAARVALREIGPHAADEEVVAVVETDMCAVDAIQVLTGCTFGKGNLLHRDVGKNAFTFYRRSDGKALRIRTLPLSWGAANPEQQAASKDDRARAILERDERELFDIRPVSGRPPARARINDSLACDGCGESVMETRTRRFSGQTFCISCFEERDHRT